MLGSVKEIVSAVFRPRRGGGSLIVEIWLRSILFHHDGEEIISEITTRN
jgi:hypothetical protein